MNGAHLHLLVNHFPIIGLIFGTGILISGIVLKNNTIKNVSYFVFIVAAIFAAISIGTGEEAEETLENFPDITYKGIAIHEEYAEKFALILYVLGGISILGLYTHFKKHSKAKLISLLALVISIIGIVISKYVGTSGGEIRHTEIRSNTSSNPNIIHSEEEE